MDDGAEAGAERRGAGKRLGGGECASSGFRKARDVSRIRGAETGGSSLQTVRTQERIPRGNALRRELKGVYGSAFRIDFVLETDPSWIPRT